MTATPSTSTPEARAAARDRLPPEQTGPAAWYGPGWAGRDDWVVRLDGADVAEIEAALAAWSAAPRDAPAPLEAGAFPLPRLAPRLAAIRDELIDGRGFALLRGLPVGRWSRRDAALAFMGLGAHLGRARSQNAAGHLLGHVKDLGLSSADPSVRIYQTHERQTFHTDSCDVVGLLCLAEARRGGDSLLVSSTTIFNELRRDRPELALRLFEPLATDRRGEVPPGMKPYFELPVFSWHDGFLTAIYQRQYIDSAQRFPDAPRLTAQHVEALDAFDALAEDPRLHLTMRLAPGDMQFVHNHVLLHDRTGFEDWAEPARRRHLLRLWLAVPGARPLPAAFAQRYGSVAIGDRGGIVVAGTRPTVPLDA
ncbi:MAG TPA: TauD/TfdA family dioxygenase [Burkholderiaceae bacterium]|nr:TauD/TfdA family dioxygenase [Burkholderiaceae bacterium]